MKRILHFALVAFVCAIPLFSSCSTISSEEEVSHISYRYASAGEGRQYFLSNTAFFQSLTQNDIDWKTRSTGKTIEEFKTFSANQIQDFTDDEKKALDAMITLVETRLDVLGICLPPMDEITFIKSTMEDEGGAAGYTFGNSIFLSCFLLECLADLWQGKQVYTPDYDEYISLVAPGLIAHELFHCLTRNNASFRQRLYSLIGFTVMDHDVEFGPTVRNMILKNPDVERYDNWAEFTINGEKRRCILVAVYECSYAEAAATNPGASFLDYSKSVLVPLDDPDTMIPIEQASDFYQVVGQNTDYLIAAEECIADNFGNLIGFGFNGYYTLSADYTIKFVPYPTPKLVYDIYQTMRELCPKN